MSETGDIASEEENGLTRTGRLQTIGMIRFRPRGVVDVTKRYVQLETALIGRVDCFSDRADLRRQHQIPKKNASRAKNAPKVVPTTTLRMTLVECDDDTNDVGGSNGPTAEILLVWLAPSAVEEKPAVFTVDDVEFRVSLDPRSDVGNVLVTADDETENGGDDGTRAALGMYCR